MSSFKFTFLLLALACVAMSLSIQRSESCADTCGSTCYYQSDIDAAVQQGCSDLNNGNSPGGYPHQYEDYENFVFAGQPPYYEFPILNSWQVYTGGSPGADRVVFTQDCTFQGAITHTGASGNDFVQCQAASS